MKPLFEIVRFTASDKVELTGFLSGGNCKKVAVYLHGLSGNGFRSRMIPAMAGVLRKKHIGFFSINTRGQDAVVGRTQGKHRSMTNGSVYEIFTESAHDVVGAVTYLKKRHCKEIYLIGHSTGANKIGYFLERKIKMRGIKTARVVFLAPGDDIGIQRKILGGKRYTRMQKLAKRIRKKSPLKIMPVKNLGYLDCSAAGYHSLYGEYNRMDQFPFRELKPNPKWERLEKIGIPKLILLGEEDEYLPHPAKKITDFLRKHYPRLPIECIPRGNHSFSGREKSMANCVARFLLARSA